MIIMESKRKKPTTIQKLYPNAILTDVNCKAENALGIHSGIS